MSNMSMSRNKSRVKVALSALEEKTMDTIFMFLGYGYIATMISSDVQFEQVDEMREQYCKL